MHHLLIKNILLKKIFNSYFILSYLWRNICNQEMAQIVNSYSSTISFLYLKDIYLKFCFMYFKDGADFLIFIPSLFHSQYLLSLSYTCSGKFIILLCSRNNFDFIVFFLSILLIKNFQLPYKKFKINTLLCNIYYKLIFNSPDRKTIVIIK